MIELLTAEEMARADTLAVAGGVAGATLMENAGSAVAEEVARRFPDAGDIAVLCGPGHYAHKENVIGVYFLILTLRFLIFHHLSHG